MNAPGFSLLSNSLDSSAQRCWGALSLHRTWILCGFPHVVLSRRGSFLLLPLRWQQKQISPTTLLCMLLPRRVVFYFNLLQGLVCTKCVWAWWIELYMQLNRGHGQRAKKGVQGFVGAVGGVTCGRELMLCLVLLQERSRRVRVRCHKYQGFLRMAHLRVSSFLLRSPDSACLGLFFWMFIAAISSSLLLEAGTAFSQVFPGMAAEAAPSSLGCEVR